ncbi:hypothetical protein FQN60_003854 [Etheostoma spectabile]|uniref:Uncharacterized protein n=1 Tax=Etheostoma spectabile TaxID=54343 RepID=A0A5J5CX89_9PERO|nr:hypothetical protein FQN60_003854 [Etheostoma spectabile]
MEAYPPGSDQLLSWENHALRSTSYASRGYTTERRSVGNIMTFINSPLMVHPSPTFQHIWFDHLHPKPLPATPTCTSSILCVIIATLRAIAKTAQCGLANSQSESCLHSMTDNALAPRQPIRRLHTGRDSFVAIHSKQIIGIERAADVFLPEPVEVHSLAASSVVEGRLSRSAKR